MMKITQPRAVIGIPYTVWNKNLENAVSACLKLKYCNFLIVLVGSPEEKIPNKYLRSKQILIRFTKNPKISVKRNVAIKNIKAEYYACLDSDSYPTATWLKNAISIFHNDSSIWAVGGPNLSPTYSDPKKQAVANALKSIIVSGPRAFTKRRLNNRFTDDLPTCNLIINKEVFDKIGLFNERLDTGEDTNLCTRIVASGGKIFYSKEVVVYHQNRKLFMPFIKQKIVFGYAVIPLIKHQLAFRYYFIFPVIFIVYLALGWIPALWTKTLLYPWITLIIIYIIGVLTESVRWSKNIHIFPLTFLTIIIGNIVPGIGTLLAIIGIRINFERFYRNF